MRSSVRTTLALGAAGALALGLSPAFATGGSSGDEAVLQVVGLAERGTTLVSFDTEDPSDVDRIGTVRGLSGGDTRLIGIDYRVQDGNLYGVGDRGGVYVLSDDDATATRTTNPALPLDGSANFGVDVNPAANALRVISARGQNLRLPFATPGAAAVADTPLSRPVVPATTPPSNEVATGLTAAAYTNNDLDATTATTLFDIDTERDQVTIQSPANAGTTAATGAVGRDVGLGTGFDIYSRLEGGKTVELLPYAVSRGVLYDVDLLTGAFTPDGRIGDRTVMDLAIPLGQLGS